MTTRVRVAQLAAPGVAMARNIYLTHSSDTERVAALIEIAGAAATLARGLAKTRHVDPMALDSLVSARGDIAPVLGRGRWLPTMTRNVPAPPRTLVARSLAKSSAARKPNKHMAGRQLPLFGQGAA